jgi:hypothetical protein
MPWTEKQVRYLLSDASPLTKAEKDKMKGELHANPGMGHKKKIKRGEFAKGGYDWKDYEN